MAHESVATILERTATTTIKDWYEHTQLNKELISVPMSRECRCAHLPQLFRDLVFRLRSPTIPGTEELFSEDAAEAFNGMFHCQNVTMAQFADLLSAVARGDIKSRVVDKTGLTDSYVFSLSYTGAGRLRLQEAAAHAAAKQAGEATVGPVEGLAIEDAVRKELGVRLEKQPLPLPFLILDHIDETPTEN